MPRFSFYVEVDCAIPVDIDSPDEAAARRGAEQAMRDHVQHDCIHIEVIQVRWDPGSAPDVVYRYDGKPGSVVSSGPKEDE